MKKGIRISLIILCTVLGMLLLTGCATLIWFNGKLKNADLKESWKSADGQVIGNLAYGPKTSNKLDLFIPAGASKDRPQALMLFIHGGSWTGGSRDEETFAARRYAKEGYFTATMDYTVVSKKSDANMLSMLDEIQQAITFLKEYTDRLGYDINQMALSGISAGGHLSLLYGLRCADSSPIPIKFIVERVGPSCLPYIFEVTEEDIRKDPENIDQLLKWTIGRTLPHERYTKGSVDSLMLTVSPASYVSENSVPLLMAYGGKDGLVKQKHGQLLDSLYASFGIRHDLLIFPNSSHMLGSDPECAKAFTAKAKEYCNEYFGY